METVAILDRSSATKMKIPFIKRSGCMRTEGYEKVHSGFLVIEFDWFQNMHIVHRALGYGDGV